MDDRSEAEVFVDALFSWQNAMFSVCFLGFALWLATWFV